MPPVTDGSDQFQFNAVKAKKVPWGGGRSRYLLQKFVYQKQFVVGANLDKAIIVAGTIGWNTKAPLSVVTGVLKSPAAATMSVGRTLWSSQDKSRQNSWESSSQRAYADMMNKLRRFNRFLLMRTESSNRRLTGM